jgi:hypothetical protein
MIVDMMSDFVCQDTEDNPFTALGVFTEPIRVVIDHLQIAWSGRAGIFHAFHRVHLNAEPTDRVADAFDNIGSLLNFDASGVVRDDFVRALDVSVGKNARVASRVARRREPRQSDEDQNEEASAQKCLLGKSLHDSRF